MSLSPVRFARTSDGVSIAFQLVGTGPPLVVAPVCPWSNLEQLWHVPALRTWMEVLGHGRQVVHFDSRGTGLSDRAAVDFSLAASVLDLAAVVDQLNLPRFALLATGPAAPAALAHAALHTDRVSHLLLWCAYVSGAEIPPLARAVEPLAAQDWNIYTYFSAHALFGWPEHEPTREQAAYLRTCVEPAALIRSFPVLAAVDATWALPQITARTLVMTRREAPYFGVAEAQVLATRIAGAQLCVFEGAALAPWVGDGASVYAALDAFLADQAPAALTAGPDSARDVSLSQRETEVLRLLARGQAGREIAAELGIGLSTVQRHLAHIYAKVGARGRVEAAAYAYARGLVAPVGA